MAESAAAVQADPYDLGDTDLHLGSGTPAPQPDPTPEAEAAPAQPPPQPRNPDGTFAAKTAESHPGWLVKQAKAFGLEDDQIEAMTTSVLGSVVNHLHNERYTSREQSATARDIDKAAVTAPEDFDLGFDASQFDPVLVNGFKAHLAKQAKEIAELKAQLGGVRQTIEQKDNETRSAWVDRLFSEHGNTERIGKGSVRQIKANSVEMRLRHSAIAHAQALAGPKASPEDWIPLIPEALKELGLGKVSTPAQAPANRITPEQWDAATLATPTHRNGAAEPKGDARAIQNLSARMKAAGLTGDSEVLDTLL